MNRWLVKSDPQEYGADDLRRDRTTAWEGVRNALAQQHLRAMRTGDAVLVYHTGKEKALVALARVAGAPQPDPSDEKGQAVAVPLEYDRALRAPVPLSRIKSHAALTDFALVRIGRLSVMPVTAAQWNTLLAMEATE